MLLFIVLVNTAVIIYFVILYLVNTARLNEKAKMDSALREAYSIINDKAKAK